MAVHKAPKEKLSQPWHDKGNVKSEPKKSKDAMPSEAVATPATKKKKPQTKSAAQNKFAAKAAKSIATARDSDHDYDD